MKKFLFSAAMLLLASVVGGGIPETPQGFYCELFEVKLSCIK